MTNKPSQNPLLFLLLVKVLDAQEPIQDRLLFLLWRKVWGNQWYGNHDPILLTRRAHRYLPGDAFRGKSLSVNAEIEADEALEGVKSLLEKLINKLESLSHSLFYDGVPKDHKNRLIKELEKLISLFSLRLIIEGLALTASMCLLTGIVQRVTSPLPPPFLNVLGSITVSLVAAGFTEKLCRIVITDFNLWLFFWGGDRLLQEKAKSETQNDFAIRYYQEQRNALSDINHYFPNPFQALVLLTVLFVEACLSFGINNFGRYGLIQGLLTALMITGFILLIATVLAALIDIPSAFANCKHECEGYLLLVYREEAGEYAIFRTLLTEEDNKSENSSFSRDTYRPRPRRSKYQNNHQKT